MLPGTMRNLACFLALVCVGFFLPRQSKATHIFGGEISYQAVAPGVFSATFVAYYWMSHGIPGSQTVQFALRSPGCNAGTTFNGTLQSNHGFNVNLTPNKKCGTAQDSIGRAIYTASFAIPNTQPQCSEWYLSVREPQKSRVANIPALTSDLYVEAYLNVLTAALGQNSPVFLWPNSLVFNVNEPATYSAMAKQDTLQQDSIVYALKPAMNEYNTPLTYAPNLSATQPLPTSSGVTLHPLTGQLTFTPNVYDPAGNNAYTVVVEATTFKKVNGVVRKISAVQRNLPVFITNNPGNSNPEFMNVTANGQPVQANEVVEIQGGNTLRFQFHTADADASDSLRVISNPSEHNSMPAHTVSFLLGQTRPTVTYTFKTRPVSSDQLYFFTVSVFDNACTVRGITTQVFAFVKERDLR